MASSTSPDGPVRGRSQQSPLASQRESETQTAKSRTGPFFPLGYKEGFSQWWTAIAPAAAEAAVLSFLPFKHPSPALSTSSPHTESTTSPPDADPHGPRECTSTLVPLSGKDRAINELSISRTGEPAAENHLVMLHGYGAGLAFFYRNYDCLSRVPGWKLWSLDLLGYGRSSRPPFVIHAKDSEAKITEAEDWFVDALEEWRKIRGIERFTLLGHSFGGYLSVRYALKYPDRVNKLILASPVGVPEDPYAIRQELPHNQVQAEAGASGLQNDFLQAQNEIVTQSTPNIPGQINETHHVTSTSAPGSPRRSLDHSQSTVVPGRGKGESTASGEGTTAPRPKRPLPKWLVYLWEANISPFSIVRWSGPLGPRLVSGWTSRRFSKLPADQSQALHNYAYSLFRQRGSGEYALAYVLAPGAYARRPLIWRVQDLANKVAHGGIPSVWMYGEMDWMDVAGGFAAEEKIRTTPLKQDETLPRNTFIGGEEWRGDKKGQGGEAKVRIVRNAGHHLYLDNHEEFNEMVVHEMHDVEERERRRKA